MENPKKQIKIDAKEGHVINENRNNKVSLLGTYSNKQSLYMENLVLIISSDEGIAQITTEIPYGGYDLELFLGDFNGDGKDEIMIRGEYGGTGGYDISKIYYVRDGNLIEIFNPNMFSNKYKFTAEYLKNNKVLVKSIDTQEHFIYDISDKPKEYLEMIYDEEGEVKKLEEPIVLEINQSFPVKSVLKKNYYLFVRQKIIGVSNTDVIGYIESLVELLDNNINLLKVGFYNFGQKDNISKRNNKDNISKRYESNNLQEKFPVGTIFISAEDIGYSSEKIKIDLDLDGNDECLVLYTLDGIPYIGLLKNENGNYILKDSYKGVGCGISDFIIKKIGREYYIFVGFKIDGNKRKLNILSYRKGKLINSFKDKSYFYSKMYMKDLDGDGNEELILWLHDTGKAYNIKIYTIKENGIKHTDKYDKIYYKEVVKYYEELLEETENSATYLYYLALAFYKIGDYKNVILTVDKAMNTEYPYPSLNSLKELKKKAIRKI